MRNSIFCMLFAFLFSCSSAPKKEETKTIKICASSTPQADMLMHIQKELEKEGVILNIQIVDDYNIPNRALAEGDVDANFFQHKPFLKEQVKQFGYPICSLADIHIEPMGIYSLKVESLTSLKEGSLITIPNDPTNEARALLLLEKAGLIRLKTGNLYEMTILDIEENPKKLRLKEIDASLLTRTLAESDAAIIPTNYALLAGIKPNTEALFMEDASSPYVNVIAVRCEDLEKPKLLLLKKQMQSDKMRSYILTTYQGALAPAF